MCEYRRAIPYRSVALSFRKPQIYFFPGKFAKTKNRIFIENPPKKVLDFVMKVQKEKEEARIRLLEKKNTHSAFKCNESVVRHQYSGGRQGGCLPLFFISLILRSQEPLLEMYAHFLVRDRHLPLVELLRKEVLNNFETITSQK